MISYIYREYNIYIPLLDADTFCLDEAKVQPNESNGEIPVVWGLSHSSSPQSCSAEEMLHDFLAYVYRLRYYMSHICLYICCFP